MPKLNILVTGGAGFIGRHVVAKLTTQRHSVTAIDSLDPQVHVDQPLLPCPLIKLDICQPASLASALAAIQPNVVIHLAAQVGVGQSMYDPIRYVRDNSQGTAILLDALADLSIHKLVVASSMSIYGEGAYRSIDGNLVLNASRSASQLARRAWEPGADCFRPVPTPEEKPPDISSIYALTKFDQERLCLLWGRSYGISTTALRFFNTYGPGQSLTNPYTGALAIFATRLLNNNPIKLFEDGQQTRDFVYVEDVAEAVVLAATQESDGCYNVGTGQATSLARVAELLRDFHGSGTIEVTDQYRAGDIRHCYADIRRLRDLGWQPRIPLEEGLVRWSEWAFHQPKPIDGFEASYQQLERLRLVA